MNHAPATAPNASGSHDLAHTDPARPAHTAVTTPRPRLSTAWWGLVMRAIVAFAALMGANAVASLVLSPLAASLPTNSVPQGLVAVSMFALVLALVVLFVWGWMRLVERRSLGAAGWRASWAEAGWLVAGVVASVVVMAVVFVIGITFLPAPAPETANAAGAAAAAIPPTATWLLVLVVIGQAFLLQGIPEELLYRGWLFSVTRERPVLTLVWTTLAFTIIHLVSSGGQTTPLDYVLYLAVPLGFGAFAGALRLLTGSMWIAAGVHGGFHIAGAITLAIAPGQPNSAEWVLIGAVYLVATAIVLAVWARRRRATSSAAHDAEAKVVSRAA